MAILRFSQRTNPDDEILFFPASGVGPRLGVEHRDLSIQIPQLYVLAIYKLLSPIAARGVEKTELPREVRH